MYEALVEALRLCVKYDNAMDALMNAERAADAIEKLSKRVPKTPHGRLIDADALIENIGDTEYKGSVKRVLTQAPTIIPASEEGET